MAEHVISNLEIAEVLERIADLLEAQSANRYRVRAYRSAALTVRNHDAPLSEVLAEGGIDAIKTLPTIGSTIAAHITELVHRRGLALLDRLEGEISPEQLLATAPGIGPTLAKRIHRDLSIETLEDLEAAAHDGRLSAVTGFGPRRVRAIQEELASILGRSGRHRVRRREWLEERRGPHSEARRPERPGVRDLLDADCEYRDRAAKGDLRRIAPRRFNPEHESWLPILHTERNGWSLTALFSNTALAHQLETTDDWVVIFYARDEQEGRCTIVTETHGLLIGRRVVRGRESECQAHHASDGQTRNQSESAPDWEI